MSANKNSKNGKKGNNANNNGNNAGNNNANNNGKAKKANNNNVNLKKNNTSNKLNQLSSNINNIGKNQNNLLNATQNLIENDINNLEALDDELLQLQEDMESMNDDEEPFYIRFKNVFIGIAVIISIIALYFLGKYIYSKYFDKKSVDSQKYFIEMVSSRESISIPNNEIVPPKTGFDFSIVFWIHINDFYENHTYWKHIFHKGAYNSELMEFDNWNNLSIVFREQTPGLWLHPDKPTLRFVLTIKPSKKFCGMFNAKETCETDQTHYCAWDGTACNLKRLHPRDFYNEDPVPYIDTTTDNILQYVDIDVPVSEISHLAFVLDQKNLLVYQNGKLLQSAKFMGEPIFNKNDFHFSMKNSYAGNLLDWNYFPDTISQEKVNTLYNKLPNSDLVPKSRKIENSLKNGNIADAAKAFF